MFPQVFQTLKASAAVKAIVGSTNPRIYRHGEAPQQIINPGTPNATPLPYVTWILVSGVPENNLSDPPPVDRQSVQVDCWHASDAGIETLADAVRAALEAVTHVTDAQSFARDPETRRFRVSISADFWGR
jgi:hypothetical protein